MGRRPTGAVLTRPQIHARAEHLRSRLTQQPHVGASNQRAQWFGHLDRATALVDTLPNRFIAALRGNDCYHRDATALLTRVDTEAQHAGLIAHAQDGLAANVGRFRVNPHTRDAGEGHTEVLGADDVAPTPRTFAECVRVEASTIFIDLTSRANEQTSFDIGRLASGRAHVVLDRHGPVIMIADGRVSRRHGRIVIAPNSRTITVTDTSTNGTMLPGKELIQQKSASIPWFDGATDVTLQVGGTKIVIYLPETEMETGRWEHPGDIADGGTFVLGDKLLSAHPVRSESAPDRALAPASARPAPELTTVDVVRIVENQMMARTNQLHVKATFNGGHSLTIEISSLNPRHHGMIRLVLPDTASTATIETISAYVGAYLGVIRVNPLPTLQMRLEWYRPGDLEERMPMLQYPTSNASRRLIEQFGAIMLVGGSALTGRMDYRLNSQGIASAMDNYDVANTYGVPSGWVFLPASEDQATLHRQLDSVWMRLHAHLMGLVQQGQRDEEQTVDTWFRLRPEIARRVSPR